RALESAISSEARLEVDGQPLHDPTRLVQVRKEERVPAKDRLPEFPDPARSIQVKDVSELVGDYECIPVIVVTKPRCIDRRMSVHDDPIARYGGRVPIHKIDVVGDNEIDRPSRGDE